jgi:hypothetical protein
MGKEPRNKMTYRRSHAPNRRGPWHYMWRDDTWVALLTMLCLVMIFGAMFLLSSHGSEPHDLIVDAQRSETPNTTVTPETPPTKR